VHIEQVFAAHAQALDDSRAQCLGRVIDGQSEFGNANHGEILAAVMRPRRQRKR